ncbi:hypothetical protein QR680_014009 [Steinernema hermaphroditum]|uniref:Uncharacterized protein n=1 Tax=Steinernema hermaphroditum TaxID=289476 RepID=A0AA39IA58_9BILA|nr:hypothetical protein QR680_014009 [Steinernema hermaphroditum]
MSSTKNFVPYKPQEKNDKKGRKERRHNSQVEPASTEETSKKAFQGVSNWPVVFKEFLDMREQMRHGETTMKQYQ